ncbi:hypothetical protein EV378_3737 [Pseudonocardia endophytica]|uniref:Uncharacterized protein n=1 Tax=Pseudonocardia endophytica TaxID=401976 RepID=A0A4V2PJA9_PSEEN|nr:hypothetical protein EV378_3737 [Pseudonocardia endophytica]
MEAELRRVGGEELLSDARVEAEWYAALYFHWDGSGPEPLVRIRSRADILSLRLERARGLTGDLG